MSYNAVRLYPFIGVSHTSDGQRAYTDSLGNVVSSQKMEMTQLEAGLDFTAPIAVKHGELQLIGGLSGIWSTTDGVLNHQGVTERMEGGRGKLKLGFDYQAMLNTNISTELFYDGIGNADIENYGAGISFELKF